MATLAEKLTALATLSPARLRAEWLRVYKMPAPAMTADLLRRGIAWRLQEQASGGLPPGVAREIDRLCRQTTINAESPTVTTGKIKPGTRLVRDWGGSSHHVLVLEDGYLYRDQTYPSLTRIAQLITGAKWSGPRFFGLTSTKAKPHA